MIHIDLAYLCRPKPSKWHYPLKLLREDGRELVCISHLDRTLTRSFLVKHNLLKLFDDILYNETPHSTSPTTIYDLPALAKRPRTQIRLTGILNLTRGV